MKTYRQILSIALFSVIFGFTQNSSLNAQQQKNKDSKLITTQDAVDKEKEKLNEDIEKLIEKEKFLEKEHQEMHENEDEQKVVGDHQFPHENEHIITGYGQIKSEEARQKLQIANTHMEHAEAALLRAEEKISEAKEKLLSAKKNNELSEDQLNAKQEDIEKAEKILKEAKEKFKNDLRNINGKFQQANNR